MSKANRGRQQDDRHMRQQEKFKSRREEQRQRMLPKELPGPYPRLHTPNEPATGSTEASINGETFTTTTGYVVIRKRGTA